MNMSLGGYKMTGLISKSKRAVYGSLALLLGLLITPAGVFADSSSGCTPPSSSTPGVNKPVGADASTYTYDCSTGMWTNQYYTFDPSSDQVTPNYEIVYTYDPTSGEYTYPDYVYNAPQGTYNEETDSVATPPAGADVSGGPTTATSTDGGSGTGSSSTGGNSISNTGPNSSNGIDNDGGTSSGSSINGTGPDSNNSINGSDNNNTSIDNNTNSGVNNNLNAAASTGDASVVGNTTGGSAATGDAQDVNNSINLLQSASSALGGNAQTFVANIDGNVDGNLLINPASLGSVQGTSDPSSTGNNNLNIDNQNTGTINNNIGLSSASGNASVNDNTNGGNATSGSASTIADVVNMIDSAINSGQSFVGVININGDLNGNIMVPQDLFNQMVADNVPTVSISTTGPGSQNNVSENNGNNNTNVTNTNNQGINNNVSDTANSGTAGVSNNTSAGSATTGNASNTITAFNLTGSDVIGANDLLVFVNVARGGNWVGMIVNAPAGATAAELGGNVTESSAANNNTNVNNTNTGTINNNIKGASTSGNADVSSNTKAGNATSGNASNVTNLLNVENSDLSLSGWFGILFINVFGDWNGNFGTYPDVTSLSDSGANGLTGSSSTSNKDVPSTMRVFRFVPTTSSSTSGGSSNGVDNQSSGSISGSGSGSTNSGVLASSIKLANGASTTANPKLESSHRNWTLPIVSAADCLAFIAGDAIFSSRKRAAANINK
jgi:hypothetical protein